MKRISLSLCILCLGLFMVRCTDIAAQRKPNPYYSHTATSPVRLTDAQWKSILPADVYYIARKEGTDPAFRSRYNDSHARGIYYCAACGNPLFSSDAKFESGTGWPSFYQPLSGRRSVSERKDKDGFRDEVRCARCDAHLGHVFDDGPKPTGLRYCMNGTVLDFVPAK